MERRRTSSDGGRGGRRATGGGALKSVCVFCGSNPGNDPAFAAAARDLGTRLARDGIRLVYGGGSVGLMGETADAALAAGGEVVGVIPHALWAREVGHRGLTEVHIVDTMHERKALMADLSDAFIAMPGGLGTLEEIFEAWTWAQLGLHAKPCGFLNVSGFYASLFDFLDHAAAAGLIRPEYRAMAVADHDIDALLRRLREWVAPPVGRWIRRGEE